MSNLIKQIQCQKKFITIMNETYGGTIDVNDFFYFIDGYKLLKDDTDNDKYSFEVQKCEFINEVLNYKNDDERHEKFIDKAKYSIIFQRLINEFYEII